MDDDNDEEMDEEMDEVPLFNCNDSVPDYNSISFYNDYNDEDEIGSTSVSSLPSEQAVYTNDSNQAAETTKTISERDEEGWKPNEKLFFAYYDNDEDEIGSTSISLLPSWKAVYTNDSKQATISERVEEGWNPNDNLFFAYYDNDEDEIGSTSISLLPSGQAVITNDSKPAAETSVYTEDEHWIEEEEEVANVKRRKRLEQQKVFLGEREEVSAEMREAQMQGYRNEVRRQQKGRKAASVPTEGPMVREPKDGLMKETNITRELYEKRQSAGAGVQSGSIAVHQREFDEAVASLFYLT